MLEPMLQLTRYGVNSLVVLQFLGPIITDDMKDEAEKHGERAASAMRTWIIQDALGLQPVSPYTASLKSVSAPPLVESMTLVNAISHKVITDEDSELAVFVGIQTEGAPQSEVTPSVMNYPTGGLARRIDEAYTKTYTPISVAKVAEMHVLGKQIWFNYPRPKSFPIQLPKRDFVKPTYERYRKLYEEDMKRHTKRIIRKATAGAGI